MTMYLEQQKPAKDGTKKKYKVVSFDDSDPANPKVTLQGMAGPFIEPFDKAKLVRMGYKLINVEEE